MYLGCLAAWRFVDPSTDLLVCSVTLSLVSMLSGSESLSELPLESEIN